MHQDLASGAGIGDGRLESPVQAVPQSLRPEWELLLCCARTEIDPGIAGRITDLLHQEIDWVLLIRTAISHGMVPLFYSNLRDYPTFISRDTLAQLNDYFRANALRNVRLSEELLKILALLKRQAIPAIPFKGPALATSIYGNLALREFGDLDVLVSRQDVLRVKVLLLSAGYRPFRPLTDAQEAASLRSGCEWCFVREDGSVAVDLHWRFTTSSFPFPLILEDIQERLTPITLLGETVPSLAPEDLLLVLCMHGSKHLWTRLEWICGVAELLRARPEMDWDQVMEQARKLGSERMLLLGLSLASSLLGAGLPEEVRRKMEADRALRSISGPICERLFHEVEPASIERPILLLRVRERWRDRWPFLLSLMTTLITPKARDRAFLPLPASLSFLHYLIRPIRLAGEYVLRPLGRSLIAKAKGRRATSTDWLAL